jgi:ribosomal protein S18 acetylase RimI-like enzyme
MKIITRYANIEDYEKVRIIATQTHDIHVNIRPDIFKKVNNSMPKDYFVKAVENSNLIVATLDSSIIGYLEFQIKENDNPNNIQRKILFIDSLGIEKSIRNKGLGKEFFKQIKVFAKENNCTRIELGVDYINTNAVGFYTSMGMNIRMLRMELPID